MAIGARGALFGFSSYQLAEGLAHLQLTMSLCVPLAGWVIVRYANGRLTGKRFATRIAAIAVAQFLISPELLATMLLIGAITAAGAIALAPHARTEVRGTLIWSLTGVAVAGLLLSPMLLTMVRHAPAHLNASVGYSADLANLIVPTRVTAVGGAWGSSVANHFPGNLAEQGPYLGLPLLVIVASFASSRRSGPGARLLLFVLLSSIVLSLGPRLTVGGRPTAWLPAALLGHLPALADALPVRFALYTSLVISIIVAVWLAGARRQRALSWVLADSPSCPSPLRQRERCGGGRRPARSPAASSIACYQRTAMFYRFPSGIPVIEACTRKPSTACASTSSTAGYN